MADRAKDNQSVRRSWDIVFVLQGNEFDGVRQRRIALALGTSDANVSRHLRTLQDIGVVERVPGREEAWRLGPRLVQIALAYQRALSRTRARLDEVEQRFSRDPT